MRWMLALVGAIVVLYLINPAFRGYHLGYNAATDNACTTVVLQWCGHDDAVGSTDTTTSSGFTPAPLTSGANQQLQPCSATNGPPCSGNYQWKHGTP